MDNYWKEHGKIMITYTDRHRHLYVENLIKSTETIRSNENSVSLNFPFSLPTIIW